MRIVTLPDRVDLRFPDQDNGDFEARAHTWNQENRARSLQLLHNFLPGIDLEGMAQRPGPPQPASVAIGTPTGATASTLPEFLRRCQPDPRIPPPTYASTGSGTGHDDPSRWSLQLCRDAVFRWPDVSAPFPMLAELADHLSAALSARTWVSAVAAGAESQAVASWHDHDLLVLPASGSLTMSLTGPAGVAPLAGYVRDPSGPPSWAGSIDPGTTLWVPRGWGYSIEAPGCGWVELGIRRQRGTDVAAFVAARAAGELPFRESAPFDPRTATPRPDSVFGDPEGLRKRFEELELDSFSMRAIATWSAKLTSVRHPLGGDEFLLCEGAPADLAVPGGILMVDLLPHDAPAVRPSERAIAFGGQLVLATEAEIGAVLTPEVAGDRALRTALVQAGLLRLQ